jgi:hypothetical protein
MAALEGKVGADRGGVARALEKSTSREQSIHLLQQLERKAQHVVCAEPYLG